jgi:hypothetical protein
MQYLLRCVILVTSSLRCIKGRARGWNGADADGGMLSRRFVGSQTACLLKAAV